MTTEDFAVQFLWLLIFVMIFVGSLCVLDVLFRPRRRRRLRPYLRRLLRHVL